MKWSEDGTEVTMSKTEYDDLRNGVTTVTCHCGFENRISLFSGPGDGPQCEFCHCYLGADNGAHCIVEKRKSYPYLRSVAAFIESLPHKVDFYVRAKVAKQFNITEDEVENVLRSIEEMKEDKAA